MSPSPNRRRVSASRPGFPLVPTGWLVLGALACVAAPGAAQAPTPARDPRAQINALPPEVPDDPPGIPAQAPEGARAASVITFGRFTHIQVNVNGSGANVPGDAANEPTIAVHPGNHDVMAIGWRQFDTITSNFRQAGFGYTTNGGLTWTAGKIQPGVFRSDPVLSFDTAGNFYYNSLGGNFRTGVFPSLNGGATWGDSTSAYGGDKQWMTIDRTGSTGHHFYQAWSTAANPWAPNTFNRSIDHNATFQFPTFVPDSPVWGTLDVASDGTLYLVGTNGPGGDTFIARSTDAKNPLATPTFTTVLADLGGGLDTGGPNPAGLLGQLWIAVDRSGGPRHGWVYVLASVQTPTDPMDVHFIRSTDGGQTWSAPVRVNDDPTGTRAFQWFGTMSVAPNGRIDAVWNDTRASADSTVSALYYTFSTDGGVTWSPNEQASPVWRSTVGFPNQNKIGDYIHMISDLTGADLAWAATFNNEEDVYYVRLSPPPAAAAGDVERGFGLHSGLPNPFTAFTDIRFDVPPAGARVRLEVFDTRGRQVTTLVDGFRLGGAQVARWNGRDASGRDVAPGVYLYRYQGPWSSETRKLIRLR